MTSTEQQKQNNSSVDNDSQVERLPKKQSNPKKLPAAGDWVGKQQELWKTEFEKNNNDELPF
jgi:hypothetical protein